MVIPFTQIPDNLLVPGHYEEIDNSLAGGGSDVKRAMVVGIKTAEGAAAAGVAVAVSSKARARTLAGAGSPAAEMLLEFLDLNKTEELWLLPLAENAAGVKAVKKIVVATAGLRAGTLTRYIGGRPVQIGVTDGQAPAPIVTALVAAINATLDMRVEASVDGGDPTAMLLTSLVKGEVGNGVDIAAGLHGEVDPEGITLTVTTQTAGTGNPITLAAALTGLGGVRYHYFISDLADAASLAAWAVELNDRYTATRQIDGRLILALSGEVGDASTPGSMIAQVQAVNCPHFVLIPRGKNPQTPGTWAAREGAKAIRALADDPAANTNGIEVPGLIATDQHDAETRQRLLEAGVSTWNVSPDGTVLIERLATGYTVDSEGDRDTSYLDVQIVEVVSAIRSYRNNLAATRFRDWKLAGTSESFGAGSKVMTADVWRTFLIEVYHQVFILEKQWCQDLETYKKSIQVQVKTGSKTRLDFIDRPVLIGQFYIGAGLMQFE